MAQIRMIMSQNEIPQNGIKLHYAQNCTKK